MLKYVLFAVLFALTACGGGDSSGTEAAQEEEQAQDESDNQEQEEESSESEEEAIEEESQDQSEEETIAEAETEEEVEEEEIEEFDPSYFAGLYAMLGDNCTYYFPTGILIDQKEDDLSLYITDPGKSGLMNGDRFPGFVDFDEVNQLYYADFFDSVGCIAEFILSDESAQSVSLKELAKAGIPGVQNHDLLFVCLDYLSADGVCSGVYMKQ